jgi:hypothetical protein
MINPNMLDDRGIVVEAPPPGAGQSTFRRMVEGTLCTLYKAKRERKPRPPDGLRTMAEAAAKLGCSIRTLKAHVAAGELRYVTIGHGKKRPRRMFTDADLDQFITTQTHKDSPCPSSETRARHIGASTSSSKVIAFSAQPRPRPSATPKR